MLIPAQFQNPFFRFCLLNKTEDEKKGKSPGITKAWENGLTIQELQEQMQTNNLASKTRYGIIGGHGDLVIIDVDKKGKRFDEVCLLIETNFPQTFTVKTINGGKHFYFLCKNCHNKNFIEDSGEIRAQNRMVVGANSEIIGKKYEIIKDIQITEITNQQIENHLGEVLKNIIQPQKKTLQEIAKDIDTEMVLNNKKDIKLQTLLSGDFSAYASRSEAELALIQKLLFYKLSKIKIFNIMENHSKLGKWEEKPDTYKEMTFQKAIQNTQPAQILNRWEQNGKPMGLHPITARELCKTKPPKDWIINGLQRPGEIEMDYSEAGGLKSILALYRALCVANGLPFFNLKTKKCPVVICDNENSIPLMASRLNRILKGMNLKRKKFSLTFLIRDGQLDFGDFADDVRNYIIKNKIGLVVIDTARRFHSKDENSSQEMNDLYRILAGLVEGTTASLLLLHHTNKQNEYRGSTDLKGMLDVQVKVQKIFNTTKFRFINEKNRWGEVPEVNGEVVFDDNENGTGAITFIETPEETAQAEQDSHQKFNITRGYVIKEIKRLCLMDGVSFKRSDITSTLDGYNADVVKINPKNTISTRTIDKVLNYLAKHKYIENSDKKGVYLRKFSEKPHLVVWEVQFEAGNKQS